jgi:hypothetical protein
MRSSFTAPILVALLTWGGAASAQQTTTTTSAPTTSYSTASPVSTAPSTTISTAPSTTTQTTAATVATSGEGSLDLPAPETTTSPVNRPLLLTSVILLGGTYGASAIVASQSGLPADHDNLYYPVVGPWMDYANRGGCPVSGSCAGETGNKALLILDGVGQGLGAIGIVTSLLLPEKATRHWFLIGSTGVHAAPSPVGTGYGLGAGGVF